MQRSDIQEHCMSMQRTLQKKVMSIRNSFVLYLHYDSTPNSQGHHAFWISYNNDGSHIQVKSLNGCPYHIQYRYCNIGYWFGLVGAGIDPKVKS